MHAIEQSTMKTGDANRSIFTYYVIDDRSMDDGARLQSIDVDNNSKKSRGRCYFFFGEFQFFLISDGQIDIIFSGSKLGNSTTIP